MYPATFKEKFPCGRGFEWERKGNYFHKKLMSSRQISLESLEWLEFMQLDKRFVNLNGEKCNIVHGWNSQEVKIDKFYVDGFVEVDQQTYVLEYMGCHFHACDKCKNPLGRKRENFEKIKFFDSLKNVIVIRISSCEWLEIRKNINFESKISPILRENKLHHSDFLEMLRNDKLYGFGVVDIVATSRAQKFLDINFPPILKKQEIFFNDLPNWMSKCVDPKTFPRSTIIQAMSADKLLLHTELIKFYIQNGFFILDCHIFFEYQGEKCFKKVHDTVYHARVDATKNNDKLKATAIKLVSNSMYGRFLLNPKKFSRTKLMTLKGFEKYKKSITFKRSRAMSENFIEITRGVSTYVEKYPIHCGLTVLHLSKLILLEFIIFIYDHLRENSFEFIYSGKLNWFLKSEES